MEFKFSGILEQGEATAVDEESRPSREGGVVAGKKRAPGTNLLASSEFAGGVGSDRAVAFL